VCDLTYVSTWSGWVYVAFVTEAPYARRILGWRVGTTMSTQLTMGRDRAGHLDPAARQRRRYCWCRIAGIRCGT
jgi:transposase InsO family protein